MHTLQCSRKWGAKAISVISRAGQPGFKLLIGRTGGKHDSNESLLVFPKISSFCGIDCTTLLKLHEIPSLHSIYTLDAVISKVQVSLDEHFSKLAAETDPHKSSEITKNLLPATLQLIDTYAPFTR